MLSSIGYFYIIFNQFWTLWFQVLKSDLVPENRFFFSSNLRFKLVRDFSSFYMQMKTVPPATSIQKVEFLLPSIFSALHVYLPESSNRAWRMVRVLLLVRFTPSLVQSISGVGKPLNEHLNWSDELYVTDWFLSSGLIPGGPGHRINKKNSKKAKVRRKRHQKMRRAT